MAEDDASADKADEQNDQQEIARTFLHESRVGRRRSMRGGAGHEVR